MSPRRLPIDVVIPTKDRDAVLRRTLASLAGQSAQPSGIVVVDASEDDRTRSLCTGERIPGLLSELRWFRAEVPGAACQRNIGVGHCREQVIGFCDDDILFEPECIARLWSALDSDASLGGVNAMILNQRYTRPGRASRCMFRMLAGERHSSYAGRVLGPAVNLLPEDGDSLPDVVPVEWLNTTCTLYRRPALPDPPFSPRFTGYSLMEDLALSLIVGRAWKLANARTARIFHDSQPGRHKANAAELAEMQLSNRFYVMTQILGRTRVRDYLKLIAFELFSMASLLRGAEGRSILAATVVGKLRAVAGMVSH
jgi:glycosyltransferase involved in cell wall biosynthesis